MALEVDLYVDIVNSRLVLGLNNATNFVFGKIFQASALSLRIFPVKPTNTFSAPYFSQIDVSGLLVRASIGPAAGATALLASQDVWTKVTTPDPSGLKNYFTAVLNLNTTELNAAISTSQTFASTFEIQLNESSAWRPVCQEAITVLATVWDTTGAVSLPGAAASYPTREEMKAMCVLVDGNPNGRGFTLQDSAGGNKKIIYVSTDGELHTEAVS